MKKITLLIISLTLGACAETPNSYVNVKPFIAKLGVSTPLDMSKEEKDRSGLLPARTGDAIYAKFYNTYSVPVTINRIEFPATEKATCAIKSNAPITVMPHSITDIGLIKISTLAECHPDLVIHEGAKFIGVPRDHDYAASSRTTGVMLQFDTQVYKTKSTTSTSFPLVFDTRAMFN
ncbi:hypothetical protein ACW5WQ_21280 [Aeromonas rivuli]|uniref:hypothetical protein n=1 Tax=Aeromonas rivuli TaxID=648794 RepID=UPI0012EE3149|nr:hypothetical protein [Aeromonas rivuli]